MLTERVAPGAEKKAPGGSGPHAVLLQPPPGDLSGPYPALAYLKASGESRGYKVFTKDLSIEALWYLTEEGRLRKLFERSEVLRQELEAKEVLSSSELSRYAGLVSAVGLGLEPGLIRESMAVLQDRAKFYDYPAYRMACLLLEAFYGLLCAVCFPTRATSSEYPTMRELASFAAVSDHAHRAINPYVDYYENVLFPYIASANPQIVGISMVFSSQSVQALVLGKMLKERFPRIHVVLGGAYLSQWVLLMNDDLLAALFAFADSVICGEGEKPFCELLERVVSGRSLDGAPNLIYPDRADSSIHRFGALEYTDLSDLPPPDYSDLDLGAYMSPEPVIPYCISRGCYWGRCAFCQNRYGDHRVRRYQVVPVEKAVLEMSLLSQKYGANHFNFSNDAIDPVYLKKFSEALSAGGKKFIWNTDLRAEKGFSAELCLQLARAGLNCVAIGFESGCQKTLDAMDKGYEVATLRQVMKNFYDAGVAVEAMGIFGFPGETERDGELTVRFLEENIDRISYYVVGLLMVLPGSKLYDNPQKYGVSSITYEQNPMMTPEPVWGSEVRMSARSVNALYDRLSRLEERFCINDYPYVGALSTNHGFLYFRRGPDILKRLKRDENERVQRVGRILGTGEGEFARKFKTIVFNRQLPYTAYHVSFPLENLLRENPREFQTPKFSVKRKYLVDPVNFPIPASPAQLKLLRRIDGKRNLKMIFARISEAVPPQLIPFVMYLVSRGVIEAVGL
ncbi:MAG: radical SAM protein [Syntrophobacteraceae bacterium]|nr:radical SAM protein [Syntrophobacteraceae bacterium]